MNELRSYPKVYNMGHRAIRDLFNGPVVVQEKVDGSQFSFGLIDGDLHTRSKGAVIYPESADKMFAGAVETVVNLCQDHRLQEGWIYRGEVLNRPRHNHLAYARVPSGNVILFDVDTGEEDRMGPVGLQGEADALGLEAVPVLFQGEVPDLAFLQGLLDRESILGGAKVEGVVVKNYSRFGIDGKMLMGKVVSDEFKETARPGWKERNPGKRDIIEALKDAYRTEARWRKAVQHLMDAGTLDGSPKDIGPLIKEVQRDILDECKDEIMEALFKGFAKDIVRASTAGLPEWYKGTLLEQQFAEEGLEREHERGAAW